MTALDAWRASPKAVAKPRCAARWGTRARRRRGRSWVRQILRDTELAVAQRDGLATCGVVAESVKNLPQVKVGAQVEVAYYESLAYAVHKPGEAETGVNVRETAVAAKPGERPAGLGGQEVTITSTIEAINPDTPFVTLKGPEGKLARRTIQRETPVKAAVLRINDVVPDDMPLTTTPPTLLRRLPELPPELAYRFVGRDLALKDVKASLIVDLIPNAIP